MLSFWKRFGSGAPAEQNAEENQTSVSEEDARDIALDIRTEDINVTEVSRGQRQRCESPLSWIWALGLGVTAVTLLVFLLVVIDFLFLISALIKRNQLLKDIQRTNSSKGDNLKSLELSIAELKLKSASLTQENKHLRALNQEDQRLEVIRQGAVESLIEENERLDAEHRTILASLKETRELLEAELNSPPTSSELDRTLERVRSLREEVRRLDATEKKDTAIMMEQNELLKAMQMQNITIVKEKVNHLRRMLASTRLSVLQAHCDTDFLECTSCPLGWLEHMSRCFYLSSHTQTWQRARRECLDMAGDLAEIRDERDQEFLTDMVNEFYHSHPEQNFKSAWIGLWDVVEEGNFTWVSGGAPEELYWRTEEPNNYVAYWDKGGNGQDCAAIVAPDDQNADNPLTNWDDVVCLAGRHFLCETPVLILPSQ